MNSWDQMRADFEEAQAMQQAADKHAGDMVRMLVGRLHTASVSTYYLKRLKRELRDFNINTGRWKE